MRTKLLLSLMLFCSIANAQHLFFAYDSKEVKQLLSGTLYIVPTGNKTFDDSLVASVQRNWKLTPTQVVAPADAEATIHDRTKYCITSLVFSKRKYHLKSPMDGEAVDIWSSGCAARIEKNKNDTNLIDGQIYIIRGNKSLDPELLYFIVASANYSFIHKTQALQTLDYPIVNLVQDFTIAIKNKLSMDNKSLAAALNDPPSELADLLSTNVAELKTRTLLIPDFMLLHYYGENVLTHYKYPYKILPAADILKLITSANAKDYCFVDEFAQASIEIYDPVTKQKLYSRQKQQSQNVDNYDMTDLNDAIDGTGKKRKKK